MLAKIHLKTACGCAREFFDTSPRWYYTYRVPIMANDIRPSTFFTPTEVHSIRTFRLKERVWKSSRRVELWYEEALSVS